MPRKVDITFTGRAQDLAGGRSTGFVLLSGDGDFDIEVLRQAIVSKYEGLRKRRAQGRLAVQVLDHGEGKRVAVSVREPSPPPPAHPPPPPPAPPAKAPAGGKKKRKKKKKKGGKSAAAQAAAAAAAAGAGARPPDAAAGSRDGAVSPQANGTRKYSNLVVGAPPALGSASRPLSLSPSGDSSQSAVDSGNSSRESSPSASPSRSSSSSSVPRVGAAGAERREDRAREEKAILECGGFPASWSVKKLRKWASAFGGLLDLRVVHDEDGAFAYLEYQTAAEAKRAMAQIDQSTAGGQPVYADLFTGPGASVLAASQVVAGASYGGGGKVDSAGERSRRGSPSRKRRRTEGAAPAAAAPAPDAAPAPAPAACLAAAAAVPCSGELCWRVVWGRGASLRTQPEWDARAPDGFVAPGTSGRAKEICGNFVRDEETALWLPLRTTGGEEVTQLAPAGVTPAPPARQAAAPERWGAQGAVPWGLWAEVRSTLAALALPRLAGGQRRLKQSEQQQLEQLEEELCGATGALAAGRAPWRPFSGLGRSLRGDCVHGPPAVRRVVELAVYRNGVRLTAADHRQLLRFAAFAHDENLLPAVAELLRKAAADQSRRLAPVLSDGADHAAEADAAASAPASLPPFLRGFVQQLPNIGAAASLPHVAIRFVDRSLLISDESGRTTVACTPSPATALPPWLMRSGAPPSAEHAGPLRVDFAKMQRALGASPATAYVSVTVRDTAGACDLRVAHDCTVARLAAAAGEAAGGRALAVATLRPFRLLSDETWCAELGSPVLQLLECPALVRVQAMQAPPAAGPPRTAPANPAQAAAQAALARAARAAGRAPRSPGVKERALRRVRVIPDAGRLHLLFNRAYSLQWAKSHSLRCGKFADVVTEDPFDGGVVKLRFDDGEFCCFPDAAVEDASPEAEARAAQGPRRVWVSSNLRLVRRVYDEGQRGPARLPPWNTRREQCCGQPASVEEENPGDGTVKLRFDDGYYSWFPVAALDESAERLQRSWWPQWITTSSSGAGSHRCFRWAAVLGKPPLAAAGPAGAVPPQPAPAVPRPTGAPCPAAGDGAPPAARGSRGSPQKRPGRSPPAEQPHKRRRVDAADVPQPLAAGALVRVTPYAAALRQLWEACASLPPLTAGRLSRTGAAAEVAALDEDDGTVQLRFSNGSKSWFPLKACSQPEPTGPAGDAQSAGGEGTAPAGRAPQDRPPEPREGEGGSGPAGGAAEAQQQPQADRGSPPNAEGERKPSRAPRQPPEAGAAAAPPPWRLSLGEGDTAPPAVPPRIPSPQYLHEPPLADPAPPPRHPAGAERQPAGAEPPAELPPAAAPPRRPAPCLVRQPCWVPPAAARQGEAPSPPAASAAAAQPLAVGDQVVVSADTADLRRQFALRHPALPPATEQRLSRAGAAAEVSAVDREDGTVQLRFGDGYRSWFPPEVVSLAHPPEEEPEAVELGPDDADGAGGAVTLTPADRCRLENFVLRHDPSMLPSLDDSLSAFQAKAECADSASLVSRFIAAQQRRQEREHSPLPWRTEGARWGPVPRAPGAFSPGGKGRRPPPPSAPGRGAALPPPAARPAARQPRTPSPARPRAPSAEAAPEAPPAESPRAELDFPTPLGPRLAARQAAEEASLHLKAPAPGRRPKAPPRAPGPPPAAAPGAAAAAAPADLPAASAAAPQPAATTPQPAATAPQPEAAAPLDEGDTEEVEEIEEIEEVEEVEEDEEADAVPL
eukprot:TRINITY_DN14651_c0_g2_i1.p1 TRINITY_DN14651_c0_g2~~TRINITY_DN14651_c0_g2_i1.p1  ORF type:complete len:1750 (+),score=417.49 TRINITY_DN14651_c0_g2_i1:84-5252(+)